MPSIWISRARMWGSAGRRGAGSRSCDLKKSRIGWVTTTGMSWPTSVMAMDSPYNG